MPQHATFDGAILDSGNMPVSRRVEIVKRDFHAAISGVLPVRVLLYGATYCSSTKKLRRSVLPPTVATNCENATITSRSLYCCSTNERTNAEKHSEAYVRQSWRARSLLQ
ncbi:unnamed protein product [Ectocarpus sp. 4 AP-2014]